MGYANVLDEGGAPEDETVEETVNAEERRKATYQLANTTFELIAKHSTAPDPIAYAVWYAYAEGENGELVERIEKELHKSNEVSDYEINEIYKAFLEDNDAFEANMNIGAEFESSLAAASELMRESLKQNQEFNATLESVGDSLPGAADPTELKSIVADLISENQRMSQVTSDLSSGLNESQAMIERLNKELEEFQDLSLRDPLTGVSNRRAFDARLKKEISAASDS
ncbi:MAG: GGDEF domain-containing protein, partial [Pseudomonadota bacterium]